MKFIVYFQLLSCIISKKVKSKAKRGHDLLVELEAFGSISAPETNVTKAFEKYNALVANDPYYALVDHRGPLMSKPVKVHVLWLGPDNTQQIKSENLLKKFVNNLGDSDWWKITRNPLYFRKLANDINFATSGIGSISFGTSNFIVPRDTGTVPFSTNDIATHVLNNFTSILNQNDIFLVLADKSVSVAGMCTEYCGWHSYFRKSDNMIKISYVGSTLACPAACSMLQSITTPTPNLDFEMDTMLSIIAHELTETVTDPVFTGWSDDLGNENADKCSWSFGNLATIANTGAVYNEEFKDGSRYLIQRNWDVTPSLNTGLQIGCRQGTVIPAPV